MRGGRSATSKGTSPACLPSLSAATAPRFRSAREACSTAAGGCPEGVDPGLFLSAGAAAESLCVLAAQWLRST
jgi:hypothetical protein